MCGRFVIKIEDDFYYRYEIENVLKIDTNYNVAPYRNIPVVTKNSPKQIQYIYWGFLPSWSKELNNKYAVINTRTETIKDKPYFKESFEKYRCLIPITGFYEWKKVGDKKYPYYFYDKEKKYLSLAGIYSVFIDKKGNKIKTCSIITTKANDIVENIHNRMPVILEKDEEEIWLNNDANEIELIRLLNQYNSQSFNFYEVSTNVNKTKISHENLIKPQIHNTKS